MLPLILDELGVFARSIRLWLTFAAVVMIFAITGPYETADMLAFAPRFGYWFLIHLGAWSAAILSAVVADVMLKSLVPNMFARFLAGSAFSALPIGLIVTIIRHSWLGTPLSLQAIAEEAAVSFPLALIFCVVTYMTMSAQAHPGAYPVAERLTGTPHQAVVPTPAMSANTAPPDSERPPLLDRLKPDNRGLLLHLSVEDHYTLVQTTRGREMILLRFADAMKEAAPVPGIQVHRSHWVADRHVRSLERKGGRLVIRLADGGEIPVSRTYADAVQTRFHAASSARAE